MLDRELIWRCQSGIWTGSEPKGLGFRGTTWHNVTSSRTRYAPYANSYNYPIMVSISLYAPQGNSYLYINGSMFLEVSGDRNNTSPATAIIPPGSTYYVAGAGVSSWLELY